MMCSHPYLDCCERIWQQWRDNCYDDESELTSLFSLDHCPEPYLVFGSGANPLYILTTNPGGPMPHQHRQQLHNHSCAVMVDTSYEENARRLGDFYQSEQFRSLAPKASSRIRKMIAFASDTGYDHVVQVEMLPFHSRNLSKKRAIRLMTQCKSLEEYVALLGKFLAERPVLAVSGFRCQWILNQWILKMCEVMALADPSQHPMTNKNGCDTSIFLFGRRSSVPKGLFAIMGSNNLPKPERLDYMRNIWMDGA